MFHRCFSRFTIWYGFWSYQVFFLNIWCRFQREKLHDLSAFLVNFHWSHDSIEAVESCPAAKSLLVNSNFRRGSRLQYKLWFKLLLVYLGNRAQALSTLCGRKDLWHYVTLPVTYLLRPQLRDVRRLFERWSQVVMQKGDHTHSFKHLRSQLP